MSIVSFIKRRFLFGNLSKVTKIGKTTKYRLEVEALEDRYAPAALTATFSVDQGATNTSSATSDYSGPVNGIYTVSESVYNSSTGQFVFAWGAGRNTLFGPVVINATQTRSNTWTTANVPVASTNGLIGFEAQGATNVNWGGLFTAQKYIPGGARAAVEADTPMVATLEDANGDTFTFTSEVTYDSGDGDYDYVYQIENATSESLSFSWAGFSGSVGSDTTWSTTVTSTTLIGQEVDGTAQLNFGEGSTQTMANYWSPDVTFNGQGYTSLQSAINDAETSGQPSPTIDIYGPTVGGVSITVSSPPLTLVGYDQAAILAPSDSSSDPNGAIIDIEDGATVSIDNVTIDGATATDGDLA